MLKTGLTSITFRKLQPAVIAELVKQAGLKGIEWGGDVHVPHGDIQRAREVLKITQEEGLQVSSYGSYYRAGCEESSIPFESVLETAVTLGAPIIRIWAGDRGTDAADEERWQKVIDDSVRIAMLAQAAGISLSFEYHEETLTDTSQSACSLLTAIGRSNVGSYWQPPIDLGFEACLSGLEDISPWLTNIHVFHHFGGALRSLADGRNEWIKYFEVVKLLPGDRFCLLEFVRDDAVSQFLADAKALISFCS
jgi:3-dehydroshikimate dehydratase